MEREDILNQAISAIDELQRRLASAQSAVHQPIAIVGTGCRFPGGVHDLESYWDFLASGRVVCEPLPKGRWIDASHHDEDVEAPGKLNCLRAGWLEDVLDFDPQFFGISEREAASMDPQQRMLLQIAWEALESAGIAPESLKHSRSGVFVGVMNNDYGRTFVTPDDLRGIDAYYFTGNSFSFASGRLSYALGLRGPSVSLDAACASSLVAVHLACQSLRLGECDLALAGGVSLILGPQLGVVLSKARVLASDGRSKAFDAAANGIGRGEGAGIVVLKRLEDAVRDRDPILGVIRGSAINHGGASLGITVPSGPAQEELVRAALHDASLDPTDVDYVEAHGTGTAIGDPIEATAIGGVLGGTGRGRPLWLGSVKANFGHLDSAAGMAGLLKVLAAMKAEQIPPQVGLEEPNSAIEWERLHLRVSSELMSWPSGRAGEKTAGVSAFGMSGMNAHLIVSQSIPGTPEASTIEGAALPHVLPISAKTSQAATQLGQRYLERLSTGGGEDLSAFCRTAVLGRVAKEHRMAVVGSSREELEAALRERLSSPPQRANEGLPVTFVFSGQGTQWPGMARALFEGFPAFREAIEECAGHLDLALGESIVRLLVGEDTEVLLRRTKYAQPAIFALQAGLIALWRSLGVIPIQVIGHSVGEIAAAYCAGALDLESACRLVVLRANQMDTSTGQGRMLLVRASEDGVTELLEGLNCDIAAINGPASIVVSGVVHAIDEVIQRAALGGIAVRDLGVDYAFHSSLMEPHAEALASQLGWLQPCEATIPMISTVTGRPTEGPRLSSTYWAENIRKPVLFADAVRHATATLEVVLELGPHAVLSADVEDTLGSGDRAVFSSLRRNRPGASTFLATLGALYERGVTSDLPCVAPEGKRISLPAYPWQNRTYRPLYEPVAASGEPSPTSRVSHLIGERVEVAVQDDVVAWSVLHDLARLPWVGEHRVNGQVLLPGTAMLEMMTTAALEGHEVAELAEIRFHEGLVLSDTGARSVQTTLSRSSGEVTVWSRIEGAKGDWTRHATAHVRVPNVRYERLFQVIDGLEEDPIPGIRERCTRHRSGAKHLEAMASMGLEYGTTFAGIAELWIGEQEAVARIDGASTTAWSGPRPHPGVVDACLQVAAAALDGSGDPMLPNRIGRFAWRGEGTVAWCHATIHERDVDLARADVLLYDDRGRVLAEALDLELRRSRRAAPQVRLLTERWRSVDLPRHESLSAARWVVLCDDPDALQPVVDALRRRDADVHLLSSVPATLGDCEGLLFALDLTGNDPEQTLADLLRATQLALEGGKLEKLVLMTRGVFSVGSAAPNWRSAGLHGFMRVLEHEVSRCSTTAVDLDLAVSLHEQAALLQPIFERDVHESAAVVRNGRLWFNRVAESHTDTDHAPAPTVAPGFTVRPDRPVIISGGRGGLGLAIAEFLVARGAKHLVLVGRSAPEPFVRAAVDALVRKGVSVQLPELDLANRDAVRGLFEGLSRSGQPVGGIVHAAGVLDDGIVTELDASRLRRVWQPKVTGLENLLGEAGDVDFVWLFSSATSLLGNAGQSNYGAANAVLDAAAHHLAYRGAQVRSFNWGAWQEVGMLAVDPSAAENLFRRGLAGMSNAEALEALDRALETSLPQVGILKLEAARYASTHPERARSSRLGELFRELEATGKQAGAVFEELRTLPAARRPTKLRKSIATILETVLRRRDAIPTDRSFDQLGVDSLMALEIKNRIEGELTLSLSVGSLWSYPTVDQLSDYLLQQLSFEDAEDSEPRADAPTAPVPGVSALLSRLRSEVQPS